MKAAGILKSAAVVAVLWGSVVLSHTSESGNAPWNDMGSAGARAADWPQWRGPDAGGVADGRSLPTRWSQTQGVRWSARLPGWGTSSPVIYGDRLFVTSQVEQDGRKSLWTLCFHRDSGKELWRHDFGLGMDNGVLVCIDGATGKELYRARLGGACNSSPIAGDDRLFFSNNEGATFVVRAGKQFELLSTNQLGERITASPAVAGNDLFYRTDSHLYCIGTGQTR